jgi:hypothetical protein
MIMGQEDHMFEVSVALIGLAVAAAGTVAAAYQFWLDGRLQAAARRRILKERRLAEAWLRARGAQDLDPELLRQLLVTISRAPDGSPGTDEPVLEDRGPRTPTMDAPGDLITHNEGEVTGPPEGRNWPRIVGGGVVGALAGLGGVVAVLTWAGFAPGFPHEHQCLTYLGEVRATYEGFEHDRQATIDFFDNGAIGTYQSECGLPADLLPHSLFGEGGATPAPGVP